MRSFGGLASWKVKVARCIIPIKLRVIEYQEHLHVATFFQVCFMLPFFFSWVSGQTDNQIVCAASSRYASIDHFFTHADACHNPGVICRTAGLVVAFRSLPSVSSS